MSAAKTAIFLHHSKTAGTTLNKIIDRNYAPGEVYTIGRIMQDGIDQFEALSSAEKARLRMVRGHMPFGLHHQLTQPFIYITLIRDPVERIISSYAHIVRNTAHPLHATVTAKQMSLRHCLEEKMLGLPPDGQTLDMCAREIQVTKPRVDAELLQVAIDNIEQHFAVVGLTEQFDLSLLLMQQALGWKKIRYAKRNVSIKRLRREELDAETMALVMDYCHFDQKLYDYAAKRLTQQAATLTNLEARLAGLKPTRWDDFSQATTRRLYPVRQGVKRLLAKR